MKHYADYLSWGRVIAVLAFFIIVESSPKALGLWLGIIIILAIFLTDGLDGYIARKTKTGHKFGAYLDILGDRSSELILSLLFVTQGYFKTAMAFVLMYYIAKDLTLDYIRFYNSSINKKEPFKQLKSKIAIFIVAKRPIRLLYGLTKLLMFIGLYSTIFITSKPVVVFTEVNIYLTLILSFLRTIYPVKEGLKEIYKK